MQIKPPEQNLTKGLLLGLCSVMLGTSLAAVGKHLTSMVDIATIVLFQYLFCLLLTLPWFFKHGVKALKTTLPGYHLVRGVSGCLCFYSYYMALNHIPLVDATLLRNTAPLMVPLVLLLGFSTAIPRGRWLALMVGFIGILVILRPAQQGVNIWHLVGFSSGASLAISMVMTRKLAQQEPENRILFYYFLISLLFALPLFIINYRPIPLAAWPWLITIGVAMYFTFVIYTRAYSLVKASVLAPTSYFAVVFAGIIEWLIWDQLPDGWTVVGISLVICGGLLSLRSNQD